MPLIGLGFLGILLIQLTRSMYLDAFRVDGSRLDLVGYIANSVLGFFMLAFAWQKNILRLSPMALFFIFIGLLTINVEFNSQESYKSVILSRYGVLTWLLIGIWVSLSLSYIRNRVSARPKEGSLFLSKLWIYTASLPACWFAYEVILNSPKEASYQAVATSGIIIICTAILALTAIHQNSERSLSLIPIYTFLILSSFMAYAIALLQSTGIIAFWLVAAPTVLFSIKSHSRYRWHIPAGVIIIVVISLVVSKFMISGLFENTRLAYATDGIMSVSSIQSRLALLPDFFPQLSIAPVFGNYEAEISAGYFKGEYIHSLPLSLLTHTGIVGFCLFTFGWIVLYLAEKTQRNKSEVWQILRFRLFIITTVLASFYAFFTWQVVWFFIGMLCVKNKSTNS